MIHDVPFQNGPFVTFPPLAYPRAAAATRVSDLGLEEQQVPNAIGFDAGTHHPAKRGCRARVVSHINTHPKKKKNNTFEFWCSFNCRPHDIGLGRQFKLLPIQVEL